MTGELQIVNNLEGSCRGLILIYYPGICLEVLEKNTKTSISLAGLRTEI
jgi:hypothetical protein